MFNYKPKGQWLECSNCKRSYRQILQSDVEDYYNEDGSKFILTEEDSIKCYYCTPLKLYTKYSCNCFKTNDLIQFNYGDPPFTCDCLKNNNKSPGIIQAQPKMDSGAKELFNRIKKRNYGATMPDY